MSRKTVSAPLKLQNAQLREVDRALYKIGKGIEILERLKWSPAVRREFLEHWRKKNPQLPRISYPAVQLTRQSEELREIIKKADSKHPVGSIIKETAQSFYLATKMVENTGKKAFLTYSTRLYGLPEHEFDGKGNAHTLAAAKRFLRSLRKFKIADIVPAEDVCLMPEYVASKIQHEANTTFRDKKIKVKIDAKLAAKASAGPDRIRVRGSTCFAHHDVAQLIAHELMVHTLTILNGRKQRYKVFGLNSPRTTCTQEGLAVFAEFISGAMDVNRLHRISARVKAIQMGLNGADFIDVFRFYLQQGQTENEAFHSTMRIFRGGKLTGGVVFTKDLTYLRGFVEVHRFFLESLRSENYLYPHYIFAGRMTTEDVPVVAELIETGILKVPHYEPEWVKNRSTLLAFLLSSSVMSSLGLA